MHFVPAVKSENLIQIKIKL